MKEFPAPIPAPGFHGTGGKAARPAHLSKKDYFLQVSIPFRLIFSPFRQIFLCNTYIFSKFFHNSCRFFVDFLYFPFCFPIFLIFLFSLIFSFSFLFFSLFGNFFRTFTSPKQKKAFLHLFLSAAADRKRYPVAQN